MKTLIICVLALVLLGWMAGYAHAKWFTPVKWFKAPFIFVVEKNREAWEKDSYEYVKFTLKQHLSGHTGELCQYDLTLPRPATVSCTKEELAAMHHKLYPKAKIRKINGFFDYKTNTVYYLKGRWDTLTHEYTHYMTWNTQAAKNQPAGKYILPNGRCLDELSAGLMAENYQLRWEIRKLHRRLENLRRALRKKQ